MSSQLYYTKHVSVAGKVTYKPVRVYDRNLSDALPAGYHLISVHPGGVSSRYGIIPALAPMIAASRIAEAAICDAMLVASEMRPAKPPLTTEQKEAWDKLVAVMGESGRCLEYASIIEMVRAGCDAMVEEAGKLLTNPAIENAYSTFQLIAGLTEDTGC